MLKILPPTLLRPRHARLARIARQIGSLGENQQPHGVQRFGVCEPAHAALETRAIRVPLARQEDPREEHHAGPEDGEFLEGVFQYDY